MRGDDGQARSGAGAQVLNIRVEIQDRSGPRKLTRVYVTWTCPVCHARAYRFLHLSDEFLADSDAPLSERVAWMLECPNWHQAEKSDSA
jgi:hypothetical protein